LPPEGCEQVLDLWKFSGSELGGSPAAARAEPIMRALARLRAAVKAARNAESRAELTYTALEIGQREGLLRQVAELFAPTATDIVPMPDWSGWSDLMVRGLLLAGRAEAAQRWLDILDPAAVGNVDEVQQLELAFALAAPNARRNADAKRVLAELAQNVDPSHGNAAMTGSDSPLIDH